MENSIDIKLKLIYLNRRTRVLKDRCLKRGDTLTTDFKISLAAARVNAGLTQSEVASALHVGKNTIVNWEKGVTEPSITQAKKLEEIYNMPLDYIFLPMRSN